MEKERAEAAALKAFSQATKKAKLDLLEPTKLREGLNDDIKLWLSVNDLPNKCKDYVLDKHRLTDISKFSGAKLSIKGRYISPEENIDARTKAKESLSIAIVGYKRQKLILAIQMIEKLVDEAAKMLEESKPRIVEKLFVGLTGMAPESFDLCGKLKGQNDDNLKYIRRETKASVTLRGKGSGMIESTTGYESSEPLHFHIEHKCKDVVETARAMGLHLLETVQAELVTFLQQGSTPTTAPVLQSYTGTTVLQTSTAAPAVHSSIPTPVQKPVVPHRTQSRFSSEPPKVPLESKLKLEKWKLELEKERGPLANQPLLSAPKESLLTPEQQSLVSALEKKFLAAKKKQLLLSATEESHELSDTEPPLLAAPKPSFLSAPIQPQLSATKRPLLSAPIQLQPQISATKQPLLSAPIQPQLSATKRPLLSAPIQLQPQISATIPPLLSSSIPPLLSVPKPPVPSALSAIIASFTKGQGWLYKEPPKKERLVLLTTPSSEPISAPYSPDSPTSSVFGSPPKSEPLPKYSTSWYPSSSTPPDSTINESPTTPKAFTSGIDSPTNNQALTKELTYDLCPSSDSNFATSHWSTSAPYAPSLSNCWPEQQASSAYPDSSYGPYQNSQNWEGRPQQPPPNFNSWSSYETSDYNYQYNESHMNFPGNTEALDWSNQPASHDSAPWANKRKAASDNRVIKVIKTDNTKPVPPTVGNNGHQFKNQSTPMNRVENLWDLKPFGRTDSGRNKATTSSSKDKLPGTVTATSNRQPANSISEVIDLDSDEESQPKPNNKPRQETIKINLKRPQREEIDSKNNEENQRVGITKTVDSENVTSSKLQTNENPHLGSSNQAIDKKPHTNQDTQLNNSNQAINENPQNKGSQPKPTSEVINETLKDYPQMVQILKNQKNAYGKQVLTRRKLAMLIQIKTWAPKKGGYLSYKLRTHYLKRHFQEDYEEYIRLLRWKYGDALEMEMKPLLYRNHDVEKLYDFNFRIPLLRSKKSKTSINTVDTLKISEVSNNSVNSLKTPETSKNSVEKEVEDKIRMLEKELQSLKEKLSLENKPEEKVLDINVPTKSSSECLITEEDKSANAKISSENSKHPPKRLELFAVLKTTPKKTGKKGTQNRQKYLMKYWPEEYEEYFSLVKAKYGENIPPRMPGFHLSPEELYESAELKMASPVEAEPKIVNTDKEQHTHREQADLQEEVTQKRENQEALRVPKIKLQDSEHQPSEPELELAESQDIESNKKEDSKEPYPKKVTFLGTVLKMNDQDADPKKVDPQEEEPQNVEPKIEGLQEAEPHITQIQVVQRRSQRSRTQTPKYKD